MADTKSKTAPAPPGLSAQELKERLANLRPPKPAEPVWAPPRAEDLVYAEVGPGFSAVDDVTRRTLGPGDRGYLHKEVLQRHPEGFLPVGEDGKVQGAWPVRRMSTRLVTGPEVTPPEPLIPRPAEGAAA